MLVAHVPLAAFEHPYLHVDDPVGQVRHILTRIVPAVPLRLKLNTAGCGQTLQLTLADKPVLPLPGYLHPHRFDLLPEPVIYIHGHRLAIRGHVSALPGHVAVVAVPALVLCGLRIVGKPLGGHHPVDDLHQRDCHLSRCTLGDRALDVIAEEHIDRIRQHRQSLPGADARKQQRLRHQGLALTGKRQGLLVYHLARKTLRARDHRLTLTGGRVDQLDPVHGRIRVLGAVIKRRHLGPGCSFLSRIKLLLHPDIVDQGRALLPPDLHGERAVRYRHRHVLHLVNLTRRGRDVVHHHLALDNHPVRTGRVLRVPAAKAYPVGIPRQLHLPGAHLIFPLLLF